MELQRSSGVLLHITSLPSSFGIGDFGPSAFNFIDFLKASGHKYWQILPLNPTHGKYRFSPYSSFSAFAGNPLLISPELLEECGYIDLKKTPLPKGWKPEKVEFKPVLDYKNAIFEQAYVTFKKKRLQLADFETFCEEHAFWLEDYSLYQVLKGQFKEKNWTFWPSDFRDRKKESLEEARKTLSELLEKEKFLQFLFFSQWKNLKDYAHTNGVGIIGDLPFYVNHDSVDCWAHPEYFKLDKKKQPLKISGVPPDYYSETGQLWGTPVYNWKNLKAHGFDWWISRMKQNLFLFDIVRLDHFRAFSAAWEVKAGEETAIHGKWKKTPGNSFFSSIKKEFPNLPFIAEDLGSLDQPVYNLIDKFDFPGMKVLQFAFGGDKAKNPYLPFNYLPNNVVYTGTHDNATCRMWFKHAEKKEKKHFQEYVGAPVAPENVHEVFHKLALGSVANLAIVPMQDILGSGKEAVMNVPGTLKGNWTWRMVPGEVPWKKVGELKKWNVVYGRKKKPPAPKEE